MALGLAVVVDEQANNGDPAHDQPCAQRTTVVIIDNVPSDD